MPRQSGGTGSSRARARTERKLADVLEKLALGKRAGATATRLEEMCQKLFELAIDGQLAAIKLVLAYMEGVPTERAAPAAREMPPFTADEAAEAERRYRELEATLAGGRGENESGGAP